MYCHVTHEETCSLDSPLVQTDGQPFLATWKSSTLTSSSPSSCLLTINTFSFLFFPHPIFPSHSLLLCVSRASKP